MLTCHQWGLLQFNSVRAISQKLHSLHSVWKKHTLQSTVFENTATCPRGQWVEPLPEQMLTKLCDTMPNCNYSQVSNRRAWQNIRSGLHISSKWYKGRAVYKVRVARCSASQNIRSRLQIIFGLILLQKQQFSIKTGFHHHDHAVCE